MAGTRRPLGINAQKQDRWGCESMPNFSQEPDTKNPYERYKAIYKAHKERENMSHSMPLRASNKDNRIRIITE